MVTDEETNISREEPTDLQGTRDHQPPARELHGVGGAQQVRVQRTGVILRAASFVRLDLNLEVGGLGIW